LEHWSRYLNVYTQIGNYVILCYDIRGSCTAFPIIILCRVSKNENSIYQSSLDLHPLSPYYIYWYYALYILYSVFQTLNDFRVVLLFPKYMRPLSLQLPSKELSISNKVNNEQWTTIHYNILNKTHVSTAGDYFLATICVTYYKKTKKQKYNTLCRY